MKIIGLSGGLASGKNFIAEIFRKKGALVFDADVEVHKLLASNKLVIEQIEQNFPTSVLNGFVSREILGEIAFGNQNKLQILEKILYPQIRKNYQKFLNNAKKLGKEFVVLNIPLLLEKRGYDCDFVVAIKTHPDLQKQRFIKRAIKNNLSNKKLNFEERFQQITSRQYSNLQRIRYADFVINNNFSKGCLASQVKKILNNLNI